jgi:protein gp37
MAKTTSIEWCDHTWTPVVGCDAVSPACANCYAALMAARLEAMGMEKYRGVAVRSGGKGKWTGKVTFWEPDLVKPLTVKKPGRWFLTSMGDVFHGAVQFDVIDRLFAVMALAEWHTFCVLTKRPETAAEYLTPARATPVGMEALSLTMQAHAANAKSRIGSGIILTGDIAHLATWPLPNVFIGCTAENQERADELRPHMAAIAAAGWKTFVSYEPALGPVDWTGWEFLKQLISGGESGHKARPSHPDWHRSARDFADKHGVAYLFKQWGEWAPGSSFSDGAGIPSGTSCDFGEDLDDNARVWKVGKKAAGRQLDGVTHDGFPEPFRRIDGKEK